MIIKSQLKLGTPCRIIINANAHYPTTANTKCMQEYYQDCIHRQFEFISSLFPFTVNACVWEAFCVLCFNLKTLIVYQKIVSEFFWWLMSSYSSLWVPSKVTRSNAIVKKELQPRSFFHFSQADKTFIILHFILFTYSTGRNKSRMASEIIQVNTFIEPKDSWTC